VGVGVISVALFAVLVLAFVVFQSRSPQRVDQLSHSRSSRVAGSVSSAVVVALRVMVMMSAFATVVVFVVLSWLLRSRLLWVWRIIARHVLVLHDRSR